MTIIGTSTSAFYDRSTLDIGALRARAEELQQQLSQGEKLSRSSDDPLSASRLRTLSRAGQLSGIDMANANRAASDLMLTDGALSSFTEYIIRAQELATQAANGILTAAQRSGIGAELAQLHGNLVSLANARDSAGHALFGGETPGDAYAVDGLGNASYIGTASAGEVPLGEGQSVSRGLTGPDFLDFTVNGNPTNLMAAVKALAEALQGGSPDPAGAARSALDTLGAGLDAVTTSQTIVGTRLAWIDLTMERRTELAELRSGEEAEIGGTDLAAGIAELQQIMLVLEASQASFAKLASLSLFELIG